MMLRSLLSLFVVFTVVSLSHAAGIQRQHGMVGGYAPADVNDPFVSVVAQFAVDELTKNKKQYDFLATVPADTHLEGKVLQAQQQVVAGRNYKLLMTVSDSVECLGAFEVTVYDHFGDLSVTKFGNEMTCEQAEEMLEETDSDSEEGL